MKDSAFQQIVDGTMEILGIALACLRPGAAWSEAENPGDAFHAALTSERGGVSWILYVQVVPRLTPDLAAGLSTSMSILRSQGPAGTRMALLLVGVEVEDRPQIETLLRRFNETHFAEFGGDACTCFTAYLGVEDQAVRVPGLATPDPPLDHLNLAGAPLSAPPKAASRPPPGPGPVPAPPAGGFPPLSRPPKRPGPAFEEIASETAELIEWKLREKDLGIQWTPESNREPYFNEVLLGIKGKQRLRFYLKIFEELSPANLREILEYAGALVKIFSGSGIEEQHGYMIVGRSVIEMSTLYRQIEITNKRLWTPSDESSCRAFVAYLSGLNGQAVTPGVSDVTPPLDELRLGQRRHRGSSARFLLVDDDPLALEVLKDTLTPLGFLVDVASDWEGFKTAITNGWYSVIVLDVNIPTMSGDKMALYVRQFLDPPVPSIILHSGLEEEPLKKLAAEVGATDYLCKGCSEQHLMAVIEAALNSYEAWT